MIYPTDFRERVQKQHKSRMYKAMLDEQVRQNNIYNTYEPINNNFPAKRYKSQASVEQGLYPNNINNYNKYKHPINQAKLLSPASKNIINHQFKYIPSHDLTRMGNLNRYQSNNKYNNNNNGRLNQQSQNNVTHIDRCLDQCNSIINNIKKTYIKINNINDPKNIINHSKSTNNNGSGMKKYNFNNNSNSYTNRKVQPLNQQYTVDDDVGRNQMMNYVLSKSRMNQNNNGSPKRNQYSIKKINYKSNLNNKKGKNRSKSQMAGDQDQQIFLKAQQQKRKQHQKLLNRDKNILEYLRKAKNKGGVLYKKIQMFKKQNQTIQKSALDESTTIADTQAQNSQNNQQAKNKNLQDSQIIIDQQSISLTKSNNAKQTNRQQKNKSQLSNISKTSKK